MTRTTRTFSAVKTEGGLLPQDILSRIQSGDLELPGTGAETYNLAPHERIGEAANRAWSRLVTIWHAFQEAFEKEPEDSPATGLTRERWLLPFFQELGYGRLPKGAALEAEGKSFAISHTWNHSPIHLLGCRVDLDRRQKGVAGAAKSSPHGLVQEFLNRSEDHLWGFVTNGYQLRVLRDHHSLTRQSYVEFDLQTIMDGEQYSEFLLLWLVCHQSRVEAAQPEDCWLETWATTSRDEGVRALDKLRGGVERAIEALGTGFLAHPKNTTLREALGSGSLDKQDYYRQLLRLVYRLIFLFVAEERNALLDPSASEKARERYRRWYDTHRLRALAEKRRGGPHGDVWRSIALVMEKLYRGYPELGLPALGSPLWGPESCPALVEAECANAHILTAIRQLSHIQEGATAYPVDWRNIGANELGSVYESLLELHPRLSREAGTFSLDTAAGHERKTTGSYYTPEELVDCLLEASLDPVLDEASRQPDPERSILDLKVCDPACGSGHFLVAAAHRIAKRLASVRSGEAEPSPRDVKTAVRDVVGRCIYGVDVNPMAVELCKVSLWMVALEPGRPLSFLDGHIQSGNAVLGATPAGMAKGIPDNAFKAAEGDDAAVAKRLRQKNKDERAGQRTIFDVLGGSTEPHGKALAEHAVRVESVGDYSLAEVRKKQQLWEELSRSQNYSDAWLSADAWCSAFLWPKLPGALEDQAVTHGKWMRIADDINEADEVFRTMVHDIASTHRFFHWHLAFPQVFSKARGHSGDDHLSPLAGWFGGFDCVLGNPPWIRQEEFGQIKPLLGSYYAFRSGADLSVYFLELGVRVCRTRGRIGLLAPNKWLRADYGEGLRELLRNRAEVVLVVDFGHSKTLFPAADTFPAAIALKAVSSRVMDEVEFFALEAPDPVRREQSLRELLRSNIRRVPHRHLETAIWRLQDARMVSLLHRLQRDNRPLHAVAGRPLFGLKTGCNQAYCVDEAKRDAIVRSDPATSELLKPYARGRDIGRWVCYPTSQWLLVLPSSANRDWPWAEAEDEVEAERAFERAFPSVFEHMKQFEERLRARSDHGVYWWELRSCDYYDAFVKPKIVVGDMAWRSEFARDGDGVHVGNTAYVVPSGDPYLLAVLNSRLMWWYFYNTAQPAKDDARRFMGVIGDLPIPDCGEDLRAEIVDVSCSLVELKEEDPEDVHSQLELERKADVLVASAYQLTSAESEVVLESLPPRDPIASIEGLCMKLSSKR